MTAVAAPPRRRFHFHPLCCALVLEVAYELYRVNHYGDGSWDREDWFAYGQAGRRALAIAGLAEWPH